MTAPQAVEFSRLLLANQAPAWQRLQAVRALAAYRHLVLKQPVDELKPTIQEDTASGAQSTRGGGD